MVDTRSMSAGSVVALSRDRSARHHAVASIAGNWITTACGYRTTRFDAEVPTRDSRPCAKCAAAIERRCA